MKTPVNEMGVVSLFAQYGQGLGYVTMAIQAAFPDAILYEIKTKKTINVEFEFKSKNFKLHKHDPSKCDLIICWQDDWKECPIPVLELNKIHGAEPVETVYVLQKRSELISSEIKAREVEKDEIDKKISRMRFDAQTANNERKLMTRDMIKSAIDKSVNGRINFDGKEYPHVGYLRCKYCGDVLSYIYLNDFDGKTFMVSSDNKTMVFIGIARCGCGKRRKFKSIEYKGAFIDE